MLFPQQKNWLSHLSSKKKINILPYDPKVNKIFLIFKRKIKSKLGKNIRVEHRGASNLGISGQDEIDVYIPVNSSEFDSYVSKMSKIFSKPKSLYPFERARFYEKIYGKKIDLFLVNEEHDNWINAVKFENYLKSHPKDLKRYEKLKEESNGLSVKNYYTQKNEFINEILKKHG